MRTGMEIETIHEHTQIDPWFLNNMKQIIDMEVTIRKAKDGFQPVQRETPLN